MVTALSGTNPRVHAFQSIQEYTSHNLSPQPTLTEQDSAMRRKQPTDSKAQDELAYPRQLIVTALSGTNPRVHAFQSLARVHRSSLYRKTRQLQPPMSENCKSSLRFSPRIQPGLTFLPGTDSDSTSETRPTAFHSSTLSVSLYYFKRVTSKRNSKI